MDVGAMVRVALKVTYDMTAKQVCANRGFDMSGDFGSPGIEVAKDMETALRLQDQVILLNGYVHTQK